MEVASRRRAELKHRDISPERTKVWTEPKKASERKVPVVYYLSRNGHLEHPHFMEVSIPSGEGLYLRDVIKRLNSLRGNGMASLYAWSSKRSYKNGFVWQDLCEDDFIYPAHGSEYILKGSELLHLDFSQNKLEQVPTSIRDDSDISLRSKKRTSWGSFDLNEYKVFKSDELTPETLVKNMDAWTQTKDSRKCHTGPHVIEEEEEEQEDNPATEIGRDEISPPSSSSSCETLEALIKANGRVVPTGTVEKDQNVGNFWRKKIRSPAALMQLLSCGSISVKSRGFSLASHFKARLPSVASGEGVKGTASFSGTEPEMEDKEYFSGSLIELKKRSEHGGEFSGLRRSSSCNAERGLKMELAEKEIDGVRARCIPRKPKVTTIRKEVAPAIPGSDNADESKSRSDKPPPN